LQVPDTMGTHPPMALSLYNTLTGQTEPVVPLEPGHMRLYVCGPTVYDYPHIGHIRSALVYDVLVRHMRASGLKVTYVRNVTDVDDKIIKRAAERSETPTELSTRMTAAYDEDLKKVWALPADIAPKVSEHLPEIQALIAKLIDRGNAYESQGDVYFSVRSFPGYGKLSHRKLDDLSAGASGRLDDEEGKRKRDAADFALWKGGDIPGASWDSAWGRGRPGWHIECSAMCTRYLGETFDLHGGGMDLIFPHHENEVAQSEAASGKQLAQCWVHHGFIEVEKEKMSKSLGNFFTARECFKLVEPEAVRYFVLTVGYRSPLNLEWSLDAAGQVTGFPQIEECERRVEYIYNTRQRLRAIDPARIDDARPDAIDPELSGFRAALTHALDEDLNTPIGFAAMAAFLKAVNELVERTKRKKGRVTRPEIDVAEKGLAAIGSVLGLGNDDAVEFLTRVRARRLRGTGLTEDDIQNKIAERRAARENRDFARADGVRDELAALGIELMDGAAATEWRIP